ncbi:MAG TPA: histidine phosphatase family protein [Pirellula sp.]|nr:histidine phosphatase family protein [Pirellula sp.]
MMRVYLVRHPAVHADFKGICYGDNEVQLDGGWESTLESLASALRELPLDHGPQEVWHSDLARCIEPAQWLSKKLGIQIRSDPRLRERFFGTWQSVAWYEIPIHEVERAHYMLEHPATFRPGGGETTEEVARRAMSWLADAIAVSSMCSSTIVAVAHSGSITALCGTLLKLPPAQWTPYYLKPSQHLVLQFDENCPCDIRVQLGG